MSADYNVQPRFDFLLITLVVDQIVFSVSRNAQQTRDKQLAQFHLKREVSCRVNRLVRWRRQREAHEGNRHFENDEKNFAPRGKQLVKNGSDKRQSLVAVVCKNQCTIG
jgi:hypothetical protein